MGFRAQSAPLCKKFLQTVVRPEIQIGQKALDHILRGDFGVAPQSKKTHIKGGLHTFEALENFLSKRDDLVRLGERLIDIEPESHTDWYFLVESHTNGVGHVRLPKSAFGSKALKGLMAVDLESQGGYLWKTLFPRDLGKEELAQHITTLYESGENRTDRKWAELIEGTIVRENGTEYDLRILVKKETGELISAYPAFAQKVDSIFGILGPLKSIIISNRVPVALSESSALFIRQVRGFLDFKIDKPSILRKRNFGKWNDLSMDKKLTYMGWLTVEGRASSGGISTLESIMQAAITGYRSGEFSAKALDVVDAVIQDRAFTTEAKLKFVLELIANHEISTDHMVSAVIVGKYLLSRALQLTKRVDIGSQKQAVRVIENSPAYWLLLMPFNKGMVDVKNPELSVARIMSLFSFKSNLFSGEFNPSFMSLLEQAKKAEGAEVDYFRLLQNVEAFNPEFISGNFERVKFLSDFLNVNVQLAAYSEYTNRSSSLFPINILGKDINNAQARRAHSVASTRRVLKKLRALSVELFFKDKEQWSKWLKSVDMAIDLDMRSAEFAKRLNDAGVFYGENLDVVVVSMVLGGNVNIVNQERGVGYPLIKPRVNKQTGVIEIDRTFLWTSFLSKEGYRKAPLFRRSYE